MRESQDIWYHLEGLEWTDSDLCSGPQSSGHDLLVGILYEPGLTAGQHNLILVLFWVQ